MTSVPRHLHSSSSVVLISCSQCTRFSFDWGQCCSLALDDESTTFSDLTAL